MSDIPATSYSTIFHCDQGFFICLLRAFEGLISVGMCYIFYKGYKIFKQELNNRLSTEDKNLYMLAMAQTFFLALYFLIFEQFFMLATIRNFLIWISINILDIYCKIYWMEDQQSLNMASYGIIAAKIGNFLLWFFISLGDGSSLVNTDFNLGYNCLISDWMLMSGILLSINLLCGYLGYFKLDHLNFELQDTISKDPTNKRTIESIQKEKFHLSLLLLSGFVGAVIMFGWDYMAFNKSIDRKSCEDLFSGDTVFRNILCFLLKIISMQFNPSVIYYIVYYSRKDDFHVDQPDELASSDMNYWDDNASDLNRTLASRSNSRADLVSGREDPSHYFLKD